MSTSLWGSPHSHARAPASAGGDNRGEGSILAPPSAYRLFAAWAEQAASETAAENVAIANYGRDQPSQ